jgi:hypothetical protein
MKIKTSDERLARRLQAAGILIHVEEKAEKGGSEDGLLIRQYGGVHESTAIAYRGNATLIVVYLDIAVDRPGFAISGFDLELPWEGTVRWLEDPREIDGRSRDYHFGFEGIPNFKRDHVLNHLAGARRAISRGRTLQGCLLGIHDPMPDSFPHGAKIPAFVSVWDQFFTEYRRPVLLWADRMRVPVHKSLAPRRNLLDHKDPEPVKKNRIPI